LKQVSSSISFYWRFFWGLAVCSFLFSCQSNNDAAAYRELAALIEQADTSDFHEPNAFLIEQSARENPAAAFYMAYALEKKSATQNFDPDRAAYVDEIIFKLYKAALRNTVVRDEAANRLRPLVQRSRENAREIIGITAAAPATRTLKAAALVTLRYYDEVTALYNKAPPEELSGWDTAILLIVRLLRNDYGQGSGLHTGALDFFLSGTLDNARRWCWEEMRRREIMPFLEAEEQAIRGRFSIADYAYRDALTAFQKAYTLDARLFSVYSGLLTDLGQAFLYGGSPEEGAALFLRWEAEAAESGDTRHIRDFRYKCLYYAGRMRRAVNKRELAAGHFTQAISLAPDFLQKDACIWYIVEMGFAEKPETGIALLEKWADVWHDDDYFSDLYDRAAQWAVAKKSWKTFVELFESIERSGGGVTRAKYAYIIGRALEERYISPLDRKPADFFAIAYKENGENEGNSAPYYLNEALLYYRVMAGLKLGRQPDFITPPDPAGRTGEITTKEGLFLQGFFTYGAAKYAAAWIRDYAETLPLDELRDLGQLLCGEALWGESIRLALVYMKRPDFTLTAEDIALYFPAGYQELVDRFAQTYAIDRGVLFGIIRTESIFIPDIVSRAGAGGLMQLMPDTAVETAAAIARQGGPNYIADGTVDRSDPAVNTHIGAFFLRHLMDTQTTPLNAILAYNGGPTRIRRWARASSLPSDLFMESVELRETREYGKKVLASAVLYNYFYFSLKPDTLVADIMGN
jgi:soluble lytic murein transglycosylase